MDVLNLLSTQCNEVAVFDPLVDITPRKAALNLNANIKVLKKLPQSKKYNLVFLLVPHKDFTSLGIDYFKSLLSKDGIFYDLKGVLGSENNFLSL